MTSSDRFFRFLDFNSLYPSVFGNLSLKQQAGQAVGRILRYPIQKTYNPKNAKKEKKIRNKAIKEFVDRYDIDEDFDISIFGVEDFVEAAPMFRRSSLFIL